MAVPPPSLGPAARLRFEEFTFERLPNGHCRAHVVLCWAADGRRFVGDAEGVISQAGELRCAAQATVRALEHAAQPGLGFEVLGVKAVRAFDATVVIVSLSARSQDSVSRLVGSYLTQADPSRGAAIAVLNATNRLLGNYYSR